MTKLTTAQFLLRLRRLNADEWIAWVERMRDALAASEDLTVAARAAQFDNQIRILRYRLTARPGESLNSFRRLVAHILADGYSSLFAVIFPAAPHHAADIFA